MEADEAAASAALLRAKCRNCPEGDRAFRGLRGLIWHLQKEHGGGHTAPTRSLRFVSIKQAWKKWHNMINLKRSIFR